MHLARGTSQHRGRSVSSEVSEGPPEIAEGAGGAEACTVGGGGQLILSHVAVFCGGVPRGLGMAAGTYVCGEGGPRKPPSGTNNP